MKARIIATAAVIVAVSLFAGCKGKLKTFEEPHGLYSVSLPGSPVEDFVRQEAGDGRVLMLYTYKASSGLGSSGIQYRVSHGSFEYSGEAEPPTRKEIEKAVIEYLTSTHGDSIDVDKKLSYEGFTGRHVLISGRGAKTAARLYTKVIPEANFVYLMEMTFPPGEYVQSDVDAFLDSFEFGPEAGKPPKVIDEEKIPDWLKSK